MAHKRGEMLVLVFSKSPNISLLSIKQLIQKLFFIEKTVHYSFILLVNCLEAICFCQMSPAGWLCAMSDVRTKEVIKPSDGAYTKSTSLTVIIRGSRCGTTLFHVLPSLFSLIRSSFILSYSDLILSLVRGVLQMRMHVIKCFLCLSLMLKVNSASA